MDVDYQTAVRHTSFRGFLCVCAATLAHVIQIRLKNLRPVTVTVVCLLLVIHSGIIPRPDIIAICISSYYVTYRMEMMRVLLAHFYHFTDLHIYYSILAFIVKARLLEAPLSSNYFMKLLMAYSVACNLMTVVFGFAAELFFHNPGYLSQCHVGFTGVIFALKVPSTTRLHSRPRAQHVASWMEIFLCMFLCPDTSIVANAAGVAVGLMSMPLLKDKIRRVNSVIFALKVPSTTRLHSRPRAQHVASWMEIFLCMFLCPDTSIVDVEMDRMDQADDILHMMN